MCMLQGGQILIIFKRLTSIDKGSKKNTLESSDTVFSLCENGVPILSTVIILFPISYIKGVGGVGLL